MARKLTKAGTPDRRGAPKGARRAVKENRRKHNHKTCNTCGEEKTLDEFPILKKMHNGKRLKASDPRRYKAQCKECSRAVSVTPPNAKRTGRRTNAQRESQAQQKARIRRETRIKVFEYLAEKGCCVCGTRDPRVLEFDHIEPVKKTHTISRLIIDGYSWGAETLRREILKCRVICANCHRLHTIEQQEYYRDTVVAKALRGILKRIGVAK